MRLGERSADSLVREFSSEVQVRRADKLSALLHELALPVSRPERQANVDNP